MDQRQSVPEIRGLASPRPEEDELVGVVGLEPGASRPLAIHVTKSEAHHVCPNAHAFKLVPFGTDAQLSKH